ncbi:MAG: glycosyltransferase family 2 protein [Actinomycetota bacterium]|nr:glycosyltransferase family 2 protein [Actinomycetota bacterium]
MAPNPGLTVSAVVVNYNARHHLLECVRSLRAEGVVDVVVADNASVDGSQAALEAVDPEVRYHQTGANLGYGGGANQAAARTDPASSYLLCMNPDAVVEPGSIKALVETLESRPEVGLVGPRIERPDGTLYPSARTFPALGDAVGHAFLGLVWPTNPFTRRYRMLDWDHAVPADVDWVSGACFLIRRTTWESLGGFDEAFFMYAEDVDLCWRAGRASWKVTYEPAARVVHEQGVSTDRHPYRMIAEHHRALFRFAARTTEGRERVLLPLMAAGLVLRTPVAWLHRLTAGLRRSLGGGVH